MRVKSGERIDVIAVWAGATTWAVIRIDNGLEDEGRVGGGGIEKRLPGIVDRVDIEREKDETRVDHDENGYEIQWIRLSRTRGR